MGPVGFEPCREMGSATVKLERHRTIRAMLIKGLYRGIFWFSV